MNTEYKAKVHLLLTLLDSLSRQSKMNRAKIENRIDNIKQGDEIWQC